MNQGLTLNAEQAAEAIKTIQRGFNKIQNLMTYQFNVGFINVLSNAWASPKAQEKVANFCDAMNQYADQISDQSENVITAINSNASAWMESQHDSWVNIPFDGDFDKISNEKMKEKFPNGETGIYPEYAQTAINQLPTLESNLQEACSEIKAGAESSGFSGEMGQALVSTLDGINNKVGKTFEQIINDIKQAIQDEIISAEDTSASITSGFSGGR